MYVPEVPNLDNPLQCLVIKVNKWSAYFPLLPKNFRKLPHKFSDCLA